MNPAANPTGDATPAKYVPNLLAAELLKVDPVNPPAALVIESARQFGDQDHGLLVAESLVKYLGRVITAAEVDAWEREHGIPDALRAATVEAQHEAARERDERTAAKNKAAREQAETKARRRAEEAANRMVRRAKVTWAVDIEPEPVVWAWVDESQGATEGAEGANLRNLAPSAPSAPSAAPSRNSGRIPAGSLSIAAGREGTGKSSFGIWLAAQITRGTLPGSFYGAPRPVFYVAVEDSWKHTLVPRLMAAGADLSKVGRFEVVMSTDDAVMLSLPSDNDLLQAEIVGNGVALVVIDPLMSVIGETIDTHRTREVRTALDPLVKIADQTGAVVLGIAHFNKSAGTDASQLITGSGAFKDVPRSVFGFARDGDERVMSQTKNSLGRDDLPSLSYRIDEAVVPTRKGDAVTGVLVWLGESDVSVRDILRDAAAPDREPGADRPPAQRFVLKYIAENKDENGEVPAAEVIEKGVAAGFTENEIKHARSRCCTPKITSRKAGTGSGWVWSAEDPLEFDA
ncbi:AAA family ATPase [Nocardia cyriacigeorgica]|uniref:AAA family ATPase n=1 Tax=Nocardia cyriacigeorgica TaxID=135487 RepID=UPI0002DA2764|nr:AAA family ATPase [Nocardia cyriacigeorgica]TLF58473.1 AAA family ATPase [Nocardia cyriacigeorgica]